MIERLRNIEPVDLTTFTDELKEEVVARVSDKISHLESSLAVAELTVALHYLLNTPEDVLIWDVGTKVTSTRPLRDAWKPWVRNAPKME